MHLSKYCIVDKGLRWNNFFSLCVCSPIEKSHHLSHCCSVIVILLMCKCVKRNDMKKQSEGKTNSRDEKQAEARKAW